MISARIKSGNGNGQDLAIDSEGSASVVVHGHPPLDEKITLLPFVSFFTDDGTETGDNDMIVNGSATNVPFYVSASNEFDIFISSITVQISDPGAQLDEFGALNALPNGLEFFYENLAIGKIYISREIKTNLDFFRDSTGGKNFGDRQNAYKADIGGGNGEDTYFPSISIVERFNIQYGLWLRKGTKDRLVFNVRDNLAGLSIFNIKAYGNFIWQI